MQRRIIFFLIFGGILMALVGLTALLVGSAINSSRPQGRALVESVTVREFAALPDPDAYPASIVAGDDVIYTGSYASGAIWAIDAAGTLTEIPNTRTIIGAAVGLALAADGTLLVVDQNDTDPRTGGGSVWRVTPDGAVTPFAKIDDTQGFVAPDDITVDAEGRVYVSDRGRKEVWRFEADGSGGAQWWTAPNPDSIPTGLAYDAAANAVIVTDPEQNLIYRVPVTGGEAEVLYAHPENTANPPGFDGVVVTPDGAIYVAALGANAVGKLENGEMTYIAGGFRGASDVTVSADGRVYVTNFDQSSLVLPLVEPRLPFAIDVIEGA